MASIFDDIGNAIGGLFGGGGGKKTKLPSRTHLTTHERPRVLDRFDPWVEEPAADHAAGDQPTPEL
jgi:hypothetical protein